jgi:hypothetical protein
VRVTGQAFTSWEDGQHPLGSRFYYFLLSVDGRPHDPAVLAAETADRRVGEVVGLHDGSRVRVRAIEPRGDEEAAGRGLDGVLVVEPDRTPGPARADTFV